MGDAQARGVTKGICFGMQRENIFFFLFQGLFLFLWIHWINYKAIWQDSEIASLAREEKGLLVLTHV